MISREGRSSRLAHEVIQALLFIALSSALLIYPYWIYRSVELPIASSRWLALIRASVFVILLALLFDFQIPVRDSSNPSGEGWVLLDASISMLAGEDGLTAWDRAIERSKELIEEGWRVFTFGEVVNPLALSETDLGLHPQEVNTLLAPALKYAAEGGVRSVRVLSDLRLEDRVALYATLEQLPLDVTYESFGDNVRNGGISAFEVEDAVLSGSTIFGRIEMHGLGADSAELTIRVEGAEVVSLKVDLPELGLANLLEVPIEVPNVEGRIRYTAHLQVDGDVFTSDNEAVAYGIVGSEENAVVLISLKPDWEPRHLLSVLGDVTGLPVVGYLRAGPDKFVSLGKALARSIPVDTSRVRRAVDGATLVVLHGLDGNSDSWTRGLLERSMRAILMPADSSGAAIAGLDTEVGRGGEWYVSGDLPPSPLSGELAGTTFLGLPPLTDLLIPLNRDETRSPLQVQLRGTGVSEAVLYLDDGGPNRRVFGLASGFWRWAAREGEGEEAYRRLWSGVTGWLFADTKSVAREPRPTKWVFRRNEPVTWIVPGDSTVVNLQLLKNDSLLIDTVMIGGTSPSLGTLSPGLYHYSFARPSGELRGEGRFDVEMISGEMIPPSEEPEAPESTAVLVATDESSGRPIRTYPWLYLLVITLLCAEWVIRRRTGLR